MLGSACGRGKLVYNNSNTCSVQPNPNENMKNGCQIPNVEDEKQNGNAETEKQNGNAEIESKENENAEIENKENENAEIESKENGNAVIESKENQSAETESKENGNSEIEGKDNEISETESKENGNAEIESKENGNDEIKSKVNENAMNQGTPLKRKRTTPSSDTSSSLMKQVALLSSVVDPRITACAAEAAISSLCDEIQCPREIFDGSDTEDEELRSSLLENNVPRVDEMDIDGRPTTTEFKETSAEKNDLPLSLQMRAATAAALGAVAAHAKLLADQEDREIENLVANIIETQMKKVQHNQIF